MEDFSSYFDEWEQRIGAFIEVQKEAFPAKGLPCAVKDNIAVEGFSLSCGSKLLEGLKAPYTATAVKRLQDAGAVVVGKTNMDEFGMGSSTDASGIKQTNNPWNQGRVSGGSSGGSAAAVAAGLVPYALGSDTGGSIRQPAAFCGVVGLKPTYGAVSRFGLTAYASSLECIGVCADTTERARKVFETMRGGDPLDQTSRDAPVGALKQSGAAQGKGKIAVLSLGAESGLEKEVQEGFKAEKAALSGLGWTLEEVEVPALKYVAPAYYTIAAAEASANLARFDGIRYGKRPQWAENPDDLVDKTRDAGFGPEVKLRVLLGTFVLRSGFQDQYYNRAQRIRAAIRAGFEAILGGNDYSRPGNYEALLMPVFPTRAFGRGDEGLSPFAQKAADLYTCCANLAGLPALSFPVGVYEDAKGLSLPVGMQLMGRAWGESRLLDIVSEYEAAHPFPHPQGYKAYGN
jgi:aspartyl-tRNA(Asn)/glutamyl-tRNA(Gln) amidotransferase subunit A